MHPLASSWFCISCSTSSSFIFSPAIQKPGQPLFVATRTSHKFSSQWKCSAHPGLPERAWAQLPWPCHSLPCQTPWDPPQNPHTFHSPWPCRCVGVWAETAQNQAFWPACLGEMMKEPGSPQRKSRLSIMSSPHDPANVGECSCSPPSALGFPRTCMISDWVGFWPKALIRSPHWP